MVQGDYLKAAEVFKERSAQKTGNRVLWLMDQGSALFAAGSYKESIEVFLEAEKLTQVKEFTSITEEAGSLLTSSNLKDYKGEDYEKVLINVYLAMAFSALGDEDEALVEARKINLLLNRMITEGKRNYQESAFARYLSAMLWESGGEYDSAYIDYKKAYDLEPTFPGVAQDLLAMARKNRFMDRFEKWKKTFPKEELRKLGKGQGELVFLFEAGLSPEKVPRGGDDSTLPRYRRRPHAKQSARLRIDGFESPKFEIALDIENTSIKYLEDNVSKILAAKIAGAAVKGAVAIGVGKATKNSELGQAVFLALMLTEQADLRHWRSLPANVQILRTPLDPGSYNFTLDILSVGDTVYKSIEFKNVIIKANKKTFLTAR